MLGKTRIEKGGEMKKLTLFVSLFKATNLPGMVYVNGDTVYIYDGDTLNFVHEITRIAEVLELTSVAVIFRGKPALQIF